MKFNDLGKIVSQIPGWHTSRKIIVIESDDWGALRTKDKINLQEISKFYPNVIHDPYTANDSLETVEDLNCLFEVLGAVKDKVGNSAVLTANTIMANPDFTKIEESNFEQYHYKETYTSLGNDSQRVNLLKTIKEGIASNLFYPQLHGREHINIKQWMTSLKNNHIELKFSFKFESYGIPLKEKINMRKNVMAALDSTDQVELNNIKGYLEDAQNIFHNTFGFKSKTFIAPSYIWSNELEDTFLKLDIKGLQGLPYQYMPNEKGNWYKKKFRYTGLKSKKGMIHLVRNAFFEPTLNPKINWVQDCLERVDLAFKLKKPAIIGSHRLNFIGSINQENRTQNLQLLKELFQKIVSKWPDVEFKTSEELINIISKNE